MFFPTYSKKMLEKYSTSLVTPTAAKIRTENFQIIFLNFS